MNKQRKLILLAAMIGIISTFLPWVSVSAGAFGYSISRSQNGFHGVGILYFILMIGVALIGFMGTKTDMVSKNIRLGVMGGAALALICLLIAYGNAKDQAGGGYGLVNAAVGIGFILSFLAATALILIPLFIKQPGESLAGDLEQLKTTFNSIKTQIPTSPKPADLGSDKISELSKLIKWREEGKISEGEYETLKSKII